VLSPAQLLQGCAEMGATGVIEVLRRRTGSGALVGTGAARVCMEISLCWRRMGVMRRGTGVASVAYPGAQQQHPPAG
jgi:hypothetical protein